MNLWHDLHLAFAKNTITNATGTAVGSKAMPRIRRRASTTPNMLCGHPDGPADHKDAALPARSLLKTMHRKFSEAIVAKEDLRALRSQSPIRSTPSPLSSSSNASTRRQSICNSFGLTQVGRRLSKSALRPLKLNRKNSKMIATDRFGDYDLPTESSLEHDSTVSSVGQIDACLRKPNQGQRIHNEKDERQSTSIEPFDCEECNEEGEQEANAAKRSNHLKSKSNNSYHHPGACDESDQKIDRELAFKQKQNDLLLRQLLDDEQQQQDSLQQQMQTLDKTYDCDSNVVDDDSKWTSTDSQQTSGPLNALTDASCMNLPNQSHSRCMLPDETRSELMRKLHGIRKNEWERFRRQSRCHLIDLSSEKQLDETFSFGLDKLVNRFSTIFSPSKQFFRLTRFNF